MSNNLYGCLKTVASSVTRSSVIKEQKERLLAAATVERWKKPYMARVSFGSRRRCRNGGTATPLAGVNQVNRSCHVLTLHLLLFRCSRKGQRLHITLVCFCGTGGVMVRELVRDCGEV